MPAIVVDRLSKTFVVRAKAGRVRREAREIRAVDDISFEVAAGEVLGAMLA